MKFKKITAIICAAALILSSAACAKKADYSGTTVVGQVTSADGNKVTVVIGTLDGISVDKSAGSSSNTENGDFYGVNAALLATNGANVTIKNATVTSSAQNGNGIFSYGSGTINFNGYTITLADGTVLK